VATFEALREHTGALLPEDLRRVAVAVECFHKASLIHDDIEDGDLSRYGQPTLHAKHGIPQALNVGDLLIGEGYRLLASCEASADARAEMVRVAAEAQRELCRGQGAELAWARNPGPLTPLQVVEIFQRKTAPAFEVALRLGAIYAGRHAEVSQVLGAFSRSLGIAYQIRDDLEDLEGHDGSDVAGLRPSLVLAVTRERASGDAREAIERHWRRDAEVSLEQIMELVRQTKADERSRHLLESYKEEAVRSLAGLENPSLKGLLRRTLGKIFNDVEIKGWCKEHQHEGAVPRSNEHASIGVADSIRAP
jgi:geranylgeranyl pyrophosphate synthase